MAQTVEIFCCYAQKDRNYLDTLKMNLSQLEYQGLVTLWCDTDISPGAIREKEIEKHLDTAQIILLLVSPDFIASDYGCGNMMQQIMQRNALGKVEVIPIILRPTFWQETPFGKLQPLPEYGRPLNTERRPGELWLDVFKGIRKVLEKAATKTLVSSDNVPLKEAAEEPVPKRHPLFSQTITRICPRCIEEFYPGDCQIVSRLQPEEMLKPAPEGWLARQLARNDPEPLTSPYYIHKQACRTCPHCGYLLPYNIEIVDNISIAIVGDTAAGKTLYISSLIHELDTWAKENRGYIRLTCLTPELLQRIWSPIFQYGSALATMPGRYDQNGEPLSIVPLIFELKFSKVPDHPAKKVNLILYDCSGEDYASNITEFARFVLYADALIFVLDPLTFAEIRVLDDFYASHADYYEENRLVEIINSTASLIQQYHNYRANKRIQSIPAALMISKSDLLKHLEPASSPYRLSSKPVYTCHANLDDLKAIDEEVKAIIEEHGHHRVLRSVRRFSNLKFFATSATGCRWSYDENRFPFMEPNRCLDPIFWILHSLGIIKEQTL